MTASIVSGADRAASVRTPFGPFAGFRVLARKDATEWVRSRRTWVILVVSALFMAFSAANAWIVNRVAAGLPPGAVAPDKLLPMGAVDNLLAAVSSQIFVIAAIFAAGSLIARERETGTLAWVASKSVTRASIWLAKWVSATGALAVVAGIIPIAITAGIVAALYGIPPIGLVVGLTLGTIATVAFFSAVGIAAGTFVPGQPAAIAIGVAVFALLPVVAGLVPFPFVAYTL